MIFMMDSSSLPTAESTAILPSITSDHDLHVSCYCEENAWRLVYRHLHYQNRQTTNSDNCNKYFVVFVSNDKRCCPYFNQRAKPKPISTDDISTMDYVCWDYHVIVIRRCTAELSNGDDIKEGASHNKNHNRTEVLDIDTWMQPYPCQLEEYLYNSFPHILNNSTNVDEQYYPNFRVVPAKQYIKYFYSDRSHMIDAKTGNWLATPPEYQPIMNGLELADDNGMKRNNTDKRDEEEKSSNLDMYIDMKENSTTSDNGSATFGKVYTLDQFRSVYA